MALKESDGLETERVHNTALAVRAGLADQETFQKFLSEQNG